MCGTYVRIHNLSIQAINRKYIPVQIRITRFFFKTLLKVWKRNIELIIFCGMSLMEQNTPILYRKSVYMNPFETHVMCIDIRNVLSRGCKKKVEPNYILNKS